MHEEALTKKAAELFPLFRKFKRFYLVGGTALALQIGHRISVDFDFFTSEKLSSTLLQQVKRIFSGHTLSVTYRAPEQLNVLIDNVKTTFFRYPYPVVDECMGYKMVSIATVREIAAMKALAVGKRLAYKDYVDWYFLLNEEHVDLREVIASAKKKFEDDFNDRLFLGQLVSLEDISTQKIDFLREEISRNTIAAFLKRTVRQFKL